MLIRAVSNGEPTDVPAAMMFCDPPSTRLGGLLVPRTYSALLGVAFLLAVTNPARAGATDPPKGFESVFNGKNLSGWHGMPHYDPYKLAGMPEGDRERLVTG